MKSRKSLLICFIVFPERGEVCSGHTLSLLSCEYLLLTCSPSTRDFVEYFGTEALDLSRRADERVLLSWYL